MVLAGPVAAQQDYPSEPIRRIVPYLSGGSTDITACSIAEGLRGATRLCVSLVKPHVFHPKIVVHVV